MFKPRSAGILHTGLPTATGSARAQLGPLADWARRVALYSIVAANHPQRRAAISPNSVTLRQQ